MSKKRKRKQHVPYVPPRVQFAARLVGHFHEITDPPPLIVGSFDSTTTQERDGRSLKLNEAEVQIASLRLLREYVAGEYVDPQEDNSPQWQRGVPGYPGWFLFIDDRTSSGHVMQLVALDDDRLSVRIMGMSTEQAEGLSGSYLEIPEPPLPMAVEKTVDESENRECK